MSDIEITGAVLLDTRAPYFSVGFGVTVAIGRFERFATMAEIAEGVCRRHGIKVEDLRLPDDGRGARARPLALARREFCALAYEAKRWSYPRIGRWLGGRDHTSILYAHRRYRETFPLEAAA